MSFDLVKLSLAEAGLHLGRRIDNNMDTHVSSLQPRCVATTQEKFCTFTGDWPQSNRFTQAQFSGDGTTIITHNVDQHLRSFLLPPELLDESEEAHTLNEYSSFKSPSPVQSYAAYPHFDLEDLSTTVCLYAATDLPISLVNVILEGAVHAQYPLIHHATEAYIAPKSLAWTRDGTRFIAGSEKQVAVFDVSYVGSTPFVTHKCGAGSNQKKLYGLESVRGPSGIVMSLDIRIDGLVAAGTTGRQIGLYPNEGNADCETWFSIANEPGTVDTKQGTGIMQVAWSPCGTYLLAAERQSDGIHVYDMRNTLQRVAWLNGRKADTTQRLGMDVLPTGDRYEVWAGGKDGCVRMWKNPGSMGDEQPADGVLRLHEDPVSSAIWHPRGAVLATCSGGWKPTSLGWDSDDEEGGVGVEPEEKALDNRLKVWAVRRRTALLSA